MRIEALAWCAMVFLVVVPVPAAEPVNLSRYGAAVAVTGDFPLEGTVLEGLCRDADGCEVVMSMTFFPVDNDQSQAVKTRLFLSANSGRWFTTDGFGGLDGGGGVEFVLRVFGSFPPSELAVCDLGDGPSGGADDVAGFTLSASQTISSPNHVCTLVVID